MITRLFTAFFILLLLASQVGRLYAVKAQDHKIIDSLTARLGTLSEVEGHDTERVKTINALAWKLMYANSDTSIILSTEALSIAKAYDWHHGIATSNGGLGIFNWLKGDYPRALEYLLQALVQCGACSFDISNAFSL